MSTLNKIELEELQGRLEAKFLTFCDVDLTNGFWSEDVEYWKKQKPHLYQETVTDVLNAKLNKH